MRTFLSVFNFVMVCSRPSSVLVLLSLADGSASVQGKLECKRGFSQGQDYRDEVGMKLGLRGFSLVVMEEENDSAMKKKANQGCYGRRR